MDSPSSSTWSEAFILSNDSGLLLTTGSVSSGENRNEKKHFHFEDSDCEEKSLSQDDSLDGMSDIICGENFNTLKKGSYWTDITCKHSPIEPPLEFQDSPKCSMLAFFCDKLAAQIIRKAIYEFKEAELKKLRILSHLHLHKLFMPFSPCHIGRPSSRSSLGSSRLSSSHNSLSIPTCHRVDDSSFITQAVSHDTLSSNQISDLYNVPFDSDMYSVPIDVVKPLIKPKQMQLNRKKRRNTASGCKEFEARHYHNVVGRKTAVKIEKTTHQFQVDAKRHSVAGASCPTQGEPIHMTLQEVRQYLQTLYSSSSDSSEVPERPLKSKTVNNNNKHPAGPGEPALQPAARPKRGAFLLNIKNKKVQDSCERVGKQIDTSPPTGRKEEGKKRKRPARLLSLKQALCNMFRFRKLLSPEGGKRAAETPSCIGARALPPLPKRGVEHQEGGGEDEVGTDFATSIQRVKDYGWYWGPISSEAAEKILSNEPDGSFIVRDSSDDHYIFSLTFKLNDCVRHVRIDHDQGNFSFGSCAKFKSQTIVEFIENAVEHSRSGRYLFFLHRRPVIGPVRVQLLHPVSRFKQVQSLQHICRFMIHKHVRRDLIPSLPLPRRMIDYLNTPYYYSEHFVGASEEDLVPSPPPDNQPPASVDPDGGPPDVPVSNYLVMRGNDN